MTWLDKRIGSKGGFWLLVAAYLVLASIYAWATPLFETPDEARHMAVIDHLATYATLPVQSIDADTPYEQEGSQPPLYYMLTAGWVGWIDRGDIDSLRLVNPHAIIGDPSARGNQNAFLHDSPYPPRPVGAAAAVYLARAFSIVLGAITVGAVFAAVRALVPALRGAALLAAGLTAFNPMFVFIAASVNNDNLVTALNSLILWQVLVMLRDGFQSRRSLILGVLAALATVSKLSGWVALLIVVIAGLLTFARTRKWRGLLTLGVCVAGSWLLLASWWYLRNWTLYHEFFGTQTMLDIFGRRPAPSLLELFQNEFAGLRISYWGLFGYFNIFTWGAFYTLMDIVSILGVVGVGAYLWRQRRDRLQVMAVAVLLLTLAIALASLIAWTMQTAASQGRLLFPSIVAISGLLALGLVHLKIPPLTLILPLGAFALAVPFITIIPTYDPPTALDALPADATPAQVVYGDVELVGYRVEPERYMPGDSIPITLYWRPLRQSDQDYSLFIRLVDPQDTVLSVIPTYPGYGRLRTTTWQPGVIYPDSVLATLPDTLIGAYALRAYVGWWKFPDGYSIDPTTPSGEALSLVLLDLGAVVAAPSVPLTVETLIDPVPFGGVIALLGYTLDGDQLSLLWEATGAIDEDYTAMVIALDAAYQVGGTNTVVAQGDAPPSLPTRYWRAGDRVITQHRLQLDGSGAAHAYPVYVGWYSTIRPARLSTDHPDNAYWLGDVLMGVR